MKRVLLFLSIAATLSPAPVAANGRRPTMVDIHYHPTDDDTMIGAATFGMLITRDGGATWQWVCEEAACPGMDGFNGCDTFDPVYAFNSKGDIFNTTIFGMNVSRDGGCTFTPVTGALDGRFIGDLEVDADDNVWVVSSDGAMPNDVFRSADDGQSFQQRNLNITLGWFENVRVAPSDTDRVYVSGWVPPQPDGGGGFTDAETLLYRSDDAGAMWTKLTPVGIDPGEKLNVDVVSPTNPDLLFARVPLFPDSMQDTIFRSADGGATWTNELSLSIETTYPTDPPGQARIAARSDGTTYLAGSALGGFHISTDSGQTWNATPRPPMTWCVRERRDGVVYACSENWDPDMAFDETVRAGLVNGTNATDWSHVVRFIEIAGPLECPDETIQAQVCEERWCDMANMFGITPPAYCNDAQLPDAGPGDGDAGTDPPPDDDCENCGCSVGFASIVFVLPPFSRRRRRRRSLIP